MAFHMLHCLEYLLRLMALQVFLIKIMLMVMTLWLIRRLINYIQKFFENSRVLAQLRSISKISECTTAATNSTSILLLSSSIKLIGTEGARQLIYRFEVMLHLLVLLVHLEWSYWGCCSVAHTTRGNFHNSFLIAASHVL